MKTDIARFCSVIFHYYNLDSDNNTRQTALVLKSYLVALSIEVQYRIYMVDQSVHTRGSCKKGGGEYPAKGWYYLGLIYVA